MMVVANSRAELVSLFSERMEKVSNRLKRDQILEYEQNMPKSYLIEAHASEDMSMHSFLKGTLEELEIEVRETHDPMFFSLIGHRREQIVLYADALDQGRFLLLHTLDKSEFTDPLFKQIVAHCRQIDSAWLPRQLLQGERYGAAVRGWGLRKNPVVRTEALTPEQTFQFREADLAATAVDIEAPDADVFLATLAGNPELRERLPVVRSLLEKSYDGRLFARVSLRYDGKMTARGPHYGAHAHLAEMISRTYVSTIALIEQQYSLRFKEHEKPEGGFQFWEIEGAPISIVFQPPHYGLEVLAALMFKGEGPFNLWGHPEQVSQRYFSVDAVDLHTGDVLGLELGEGFVRVYLPEEACGNTVARLYTNLQQCVDPAAEIYGGDGADLFEHPV